MSKDTASRVTELYGMMDDLLIAYARATPEQRNGFHAALKSCGLSAAEAGSNLSANLKRLR